MHVIVWDSGGSRAGWATFVHRVLAAVNMTAGGPRVRATREGGRHPVGTIAAGERTWRLRPGQLLVIPDRLDPAGWHVGGPAGY